MPVELVLDARLHLGESPAWDAEAGILHFVNIHSGDLHSLCNADGTHRTISLGEPVGCIAPAGKSRLLVALLSGLWLFDPNIGEKILLCSPETHIPGNRFNDGKCDPAGRFLVGTMDDAEQEASGSLYAISPDGISKKLLSALRISNGLTWSPDHRTFYFIDTPTRLIMAYDYDLETGNIHSPRPAVHVPEKLGWPDGMTSDAEGMLWVAMWGGAQVTRWDPAVGRLIAAFPVPALHVSSCIFGGNGLHDLYITSARKGMNADQLEEYPHSGGLFRLNTETTGMPTFSFGE